MNDIYKIKDEWLKNAKVNKEQYEKMYKESISDNENFWSEQGKRIDWFKPYNKIKDVLYSKDEVKIKWYFDGTTNVSYNCVDRHAKNTPDKTAIIWEGDDPAKVKKISYKKLEEDVVENSGDFMDQAMENGNLLDHVHSNFKLEKNYLFAYGDKEPTPWYFYFIISSKINKCFYIILFFQGIEDFQVAYCIKKVKSKNLAIKFLKKEQKKLEKNKFYIKG